MMRRPTAVAPTKTSQRIYRSIRGQILDGSLRAGAPLASTRALAIELAVSRSTVTAVYEQLAAEGYLETQRGKRAVVAAGVAPAPRHDRMKAEPAGSGLQREHGQRDGAGREVVGRGISSREVGDREISSYAKRISLFEAATGTGTEPSSIIDFRYGALSADDFPLLAWRKAYNRVLVQRQQRLGYGEPEGEAPLRHALRGYLHRARGLQCEADQIVIVHGSQQAIALCTQLLVNPKDVVVVEDPGYVMARRVFEAAGAQVLPVPVDDQGLDTRRLPAKACKLIYLTPSHQFPLGGVLPINRRKELLAWAVRQRAWIIEDDYDGEFRYGMRPVDALQAIDDSNGVIYVGTFSKALSPQLRLGYVVLPPALVALFRQAKCLADRHAPRLDQLVLAALIEDGSYERHVRRCRRMNELRRGTLLQALEKHLPDAVIVDGAASGLHVVIWFARVPAQDEARFAEHARANGVGIRPLSPLYASASSSRQRDCAGYVIGYASLPVETIVLGVRRLAGALRKFLA